ncbi:MAG: TonB-dependent receptor [Saprospiraceae bacterium]|nr:TonB-dependent receptor [Saprospiraceae bacterium]
MKKEKQQVKNSLKKLMKMTLTQLCLSILMTTFLFAGSPKAQDILNKPVSIRLENAELRDALAQIERTADVQFVYSSKAIQANRKVTIAANNKRLSDVLDATLKPLKIGYKVIGGQIMLNADLKKEELPPLSTSDINNHKPLKINAGQPITGTIKDEKGEPMPSINIIIKGTTKGTQTDLDGKFSIEAEVGQVLVISSVGYIKQEVTVTKDMATLNIVLKEDLATLGEVTVVGSRGKPRTDVERPVPVDVLSAKELQLTGQTDLGQMVQFNSPSFNSAKTGINGVANYADPATLRGLSPDQVLVLVNGKRRHQFSALNLNVTVGLGTVVTDMNSIPALALDRIEVLRDGAAAQYGSDAIAGIVNVGLNKSVGVGTFRTQYGVTKEGDGSNYMGALNYGFKLGKKEGGFLNMTLHYQHADGTDRSDFYNPQPVAGGTYTGIYSNTRATDDSIRKARGFWPATDSFRVTKYGSNQNTAYQGFYNLNLPLSNGWNLYSFGGASLKDVLAYGFFRVATATNANSTPEIFPNGYAPELPGKTVDYSTVVGVNRQVKDGWNMDFSTAYGYNYLDLWANNTTNPSMGASSPTDFYVGRSSFGQSTTEANLSKNFKDFLGTKSFNLALGSQLRIDQFKLGAGSPESYLAGPLATTKGKAPGSSGRPGIANTDETDQKRTNIGIYADVESDITDKFLVAAALRYENYSDFGSNISGKLATRLKLTEGFSVRGSINKGFRAPSLQQVFSSQTTSTVQAGAIVQTKQLPNSDTRLAQLGIEQPKAENSWNYNIGVTAKAGEKFLFTLDAYQIDITDRIIVSERMLSSAIPAVKTLFPGISEIRFFTNHINTTTKGIDFVSTFKQAINEKQRFTASLALTLNETKITKIKDTPSQLSAGATSKILIIDTVSISLIETAQPRQKAHLALGYQIGKFNLGWRTSYFGEVTAWEKPSGKPHISQTFGAKMLHDANITYAITPKILVTLGANNLTDVYPDRVAKNFAGYSNGQIPFTRNANQFGFNGASYYVNATVNF